MELIETITSRRSIRKYKNIDVSNDMINSLIEAARFAPSAKNRQPWEFVILKDAMKNKVADIMLENEKKKEELENKICSYNSSVIATANVIKEAPVLILVFRPNDINWKIGDTLSIGAAIEHICLRATDLGLGSLWIRDIVYTKEKIASLINKNDLELISAISIGYQDENPKQRPRKSLEEILKWY